MKSSCRFISVIVSFACMTTSSWGWSSFPPSGETSRRSALDGILASTAVVGSTWLNSPRLASAASSGSTEGKLLNLSNEELAQMIAKDVDVNQFMVRADLTRSIYDESATFTDEIDTYQLDPWIKGTKRLFVADKSQVSLVKDSMKVTNTEATFLFTEYLTFNIPLLQPKVYLSGKVILRRDPSTGLITSYQEKWDQDVNTVLLSAKLGGGN